MGMISLLIAFAGQVHAGPYTYSQGNVIMVKPIELHGNGGESLTLNSGPVSLEVDTYGLFSGDGSVVISNAAGRVTMTIPRDTFKSSWVFFTPAPSLRGDFALSGRDSTQVTQDSPREDWVNCSVPATELQIVGDDGRPLVLPSRDNRNSPLRIRLCSQVVNGQIEVKQVTGMTTSCDGRQSVVRQIEKTQQMYTIEILDPATSQAVGKIEAGAPDKITTNDKIVRKLTPCSR